MYSDAQILSNIIIDVKMTKIRNPNSEYIPSGR